MFLQAGDGHRHIIGQSPMIEFGHLLQAQQISQSISSRGVLLFEPSTLRAMHGCGRGGAHEAPVEKGREAK
jgi:hypothetical protein